MADTLGVGENLIRRIDDCQVPSGAVGIWWLGQASFVIKGAGVTVYLDPYLAPNPRRLAPPPLRPEQVSNADVVLCTHDHGDHIDPFSLPGIASSSPSAQIVVPAVAREKVVSFGIPEERVVAALVDEALTFGPLTVLPIPAAHESLDWSQEHGYPYLGYVLSLNGITLYHAGDTVWYEGMIERLQAGRPDVVMLPINGHDWKRLRRRTIGNLNYREAADLANEIGADLVIPMHFGMFDGNSEPPGHFVDYLVETYPEQRFKVMARQEGFVYHKGEC